MDLDLLRDYYQFKSGKDFELTPDFIDSFQNGFSYDDYHHAFDIDQELVDANIDFLKILPFSRFTGLIIRNVKEVDWEKIKDFGVFQKITRIRFFDSKIEGFFKLSDEMDNVKCIEIDEYEDQIPQIIDDEIGLLKGVESLSIHLSSENSLEVPASITTLKSLKHLSLFCKFSFEKKIENLSSLKSLFIGNLKQDSNPSDLAYAINNLSSLEELSIGNLKQDSNTSDLTHAINNHGNLKHLYYGHADNTSEYPDFSAIMSRLTSFSLSSFKKKNIPQFIEKGKNLQKLRISIDCDAIPEWISKLSKLEILILSDPFNGKFPLIINEMKSLKMIDVSNCLELRMNPEKSKKILELFPNINIYPLRE